MNGKAFKYVIKRYEEEEGKYNNYLEKKKKRIVDIKRVEEENIKKRILGTKNKDKYIENDNEDRDKGIRLL